MHKLRSRAGRLLATAFLLLPTVGYAASASSEAPIVFVADSRSMTGWRAWCTNLYNENLLGFTLLTIVVIPVLALILGTLTNFLLSRTGINLKSRVLAEH